MIAEETILAGNHDPDSRNGLVGLRQALRRFRSGQKNSRSGFGESENANQKNLNVSQLVRRPSSVVNALCAARLAPGLKNVL